MSKEFKIEVRLNKKDNELPMAYFQPSTEGKVSWNCDYDQEGRIVSVYSYKYGDDKDKKVQLMGSMEEVLKTRDILVENGWEKVKPPDVLTKYADGTEGNLNRKERRYLARKIKALDKKNPFEKKEN